MTEGVEGTRQARPPGRPRDPGIEDMVMRAVIGRLAVDGYSRMTIADIAADAGVSRPTIYRRWPGKRDLVIAALDLSFRREQASLPPLDLDGVPAIDAVKAELRRLSPNNGERRAVGLIGSVLAEDTHTPELIHIFREHAIEPRMRRLMETLQELQWRRRLRSDLDIDQISTLLYGCYFADYIRTGEIHADLADRAVDALWPAISAE
ncbi:MAG TPA: TetR/AcrR family transcriptional regulator [Pseudonocardiaceae bacterium]|nr:TetR/AcrR family transcriptional regulator [Pseudonocardiaceae bacterium]